MKIIPINALKVDYNISIFITGSRANLLSSNISMLLSEWYIGIDIFPFSYKEYIEINQYNESEET